MHRTEGHGERLLVAYAPENDGMKSENKHDFHSRSSHSGFPYVAGFQNLALVLLATFSQSSRRPRNSVERARYAFLGRSKKLCFCDVSKIEIL